MKNEKLLKYLENLIEIKIEIALRIEELEPLRRDILEFLDNEKGDI